jgi:hypothetical protein
MCDKLQSLKREAVLVIREVRKIRRSRDVSFLEDAELNGKKHQSLNAVVKHLLAGHAGQPCPAGERPIVRIDKTAQLRLWMDIRQAFRRATTTRPHALT